MNLLSLPALLATVLFSLTASAYIPEYGMIMSRLADTHGRGAYLIEQEVRVLREGEASTVKETWIVSGDRGLHLTLEGKGALVNLVSGSILFESTNKFYLDPIHGSRQQRLGDDWIEPLLHYRSSADLRSRLVALKIAPAESIHDRAPMPADRPPQYEPPAFVRLSRVSGTLTWAIGLGPEQGIKPTVWIEQDQFVLRKLRTQSQAMLKADDYNKYDETFWFPKVRTYSFPTAAGLASVQVTTTQVKPLGKLKPDDPRFKRATLNSPGAAALKLPEQDILREFYLRFR